MDCSIPSGVPLNELLALPVAEKLAVIGALWDSIDEASSPVPVSAWQLEEIERRDAAEQTSPEPTMTWEEAEIRVRSAHAKNRAT